MKTQTEEKQMTPKNDVAYVIPVETLGDLSRVFVDQVHTIDETKKIYLFNLELKGKDYDPRRNTNKNGQ
ncbi:MAG: hypothetical protein EHM38_01470 [Geobacteraceae bacterium]|nr:MAG: hypothetical protein EHM38_05600 [Geobacteraceae bacterium]RPI71244.1 MAG: hypothetical protein EHM38_04155 [Geobacteraceae bacterium]RPI72749.1 MAG: hypothetical protein EHM38_01470 [Geobacteraceae bacterium]